MLCAPALACPLSQCRESKQQAQRNKAIGNNSNLRLAQFE